MKKLHWLAVFSILCLAAFQPVHAQNQAVQSYITGSSLYSQKNYDGALASYQTAVQMSPRFWQAFQGLGNCYFAKGDSQSALNCYQKALDLNPDNPQLSQFVQGLKAQMAASAASPGVPSNTVSSTETPTDGIDRNLPRQGKVVWEIEDTDWIGSWNDLQEFYEDTITTTSTVYGVKLGLGGAYAISPNFQIGLKGQFMTKTPQTIVATGESFAYEEHAIGGAIEFEGDFPLDKGVNFMPSFQAGIYTLVGTNVTLSGLYSYSANLTDTEPGFMVSANIELLMDKKKTWALDLGLNYQYLQFSNLTDTPVIGGEVVTPFILKNSDGSNAYLDFSGFGLVLAARFF